MTALQQEPISPAMPGDVIGYLRVSSKTQTGLDAFGLDVQRQQIEAWCEANGRRVVEWFSDEGISGTTPFAERRGLASAAARLAADGLDGLVAAHLDRIARSLHEQEAFFAHAWRSGHRVYVADIGEVLADDPADPMRTAMRQVFGAFAQLERGMIRLRLESGRQAKKDAGGWYSGTPPYGWTSTGHGELVIVPEQQEVIAWVLRARSTGRTWDALAAALNASPNPGPTGGKWHVSAIRRIVARGAGWVPPGAVAPGAEVVATG